jgi:hypothetical protein
MAIVTMDYFLFAERQLSPFSPPRHHARAFSPRHYAIFDY